MNKQQFLDYVKNHCDNKGIEFKVFEGKTAMTVMTNSPCSGFFESNEKIKPTLGIAKDLEGSTFFEVLAHEFSHSNQYLEKDPAWDNSRLSSEEVRKYSERLNKDLSSLETGDVLDFWWSKVIELSSEEADSLTLRTTAVEFDCERRTVELIKSLGLALNSQEYAQKANAYLATYFFARKHRRFTTPGHSTYTKKEVWGLFPKEVDEEFCQNLPEAVEKAIWEHCVLD